VSKAQNAIPSAKRDGEDMMRNVRLALLLDEKKSSNRATTVLKQEVLLQQLETEMEDHEEDVVKRFERLRAECNALSCGWTNQSDQG
jgi:Zn-dependent M16 (insulinase) family peptidase